uniref:Movement protein TGBp3 n=1 Tax=Magnolia carlavirus TaxID=1346080 RepID=T1RSB3_9VIRU|nr:TGB3 [Magnolia carlavirus]
MPMWTNPLIALILVASFIITLFLMQSSHDEGCVIILTGESIRIAGCSLSPEHITALSHLRALQVDL